MKSNFCIKLACLLFIALTFSCSRKSDNGSGTGIAGDSLPDPISQLTEKIKANPNNHTLYWERSRWLLSKKMFAGAETDILKAISLDSTRADYYLQQADIYFTGTNLSGAERALKKAIEVDPKLTDAYLKLSEIYLYLQQYDESMRYANDALKQDKSIAKAYFLKGFIFKENKDTARAISSFQTAIEQNENYYDAFIQLGNLSADQKNKLALDYYNRALALRPNSLEALYNRGLYFQNNNRIEAAKQDYESILKINPNYANAFFNLGFIALSKEKNYPSAVAYFSKALAVDEHYVEAYYNRGVAYEKSGERNKAIMDYKKSLSIFPSYELAKVALKRMEK